MTETEDILHHMEEIASEEYNDINEYKSGATTYKHYKYKGFVTACWKVDCLLRLAEILNLPEELIHKYRLNNNDPRFNKTLVP